MSVHTAICTPNMRNRGRTTATYRAGFLRSRELFTRSAPMVIEGVHVKWPCGRSFVTMFRGAVLVVRRSGYRIPRTVFAVKSPRIFGDWLRDLMPVDPAVLLIPGNESARGARSGVSVSDSAPMCPSVIIRPNLTPVARPCTCYLPPIAPDHDLVTAKRCAGQTMTPRT